MKKSTAYEINAALTVIIAAAIIVIAVMIAHQRPVKWDLTKNKANTLSPQSKEILKGLQSSIKAVVFTENPSRRSNIEKLMKLYKNEGNKFSYVFYEPNKNPEKSEEYGVTLDPCLYLETDAGKREKIIEITEENITNSIVKILSSTEKKVYMLSGHGELPINDPENIKSLDILKTAMEKEIYSLDSLNLKQTGKIPEDASLIIIAGPTIPFYPKEIQILEKYMSEGGKTLWLTGSSFPEETKKIFAKYGFSQYPGQIEDETGKIIGESTSITLALSAMPSSVTKGFDPTKTLYFMPLCGALKFEKNVEGTTIEPVLNANQNCSIKTKNGEPVDIDNLGIIMGITIERPVKDSEKTEKIVVLGSSLMASGQYVNRGDNINLLLNSAAWLVEEKNLIAIRPKDEISAPLKMTPMETNQFFFKTVIAMPILILGFWLSLRIAKKVAGKK